MTTTAPLRHSAALELADDALDDAGEVVGVEGVGDRAASIWFIDEAFGGEEALDLVAALAKLFS